MGWRPRTAEHPALEICCGSKNLYCMVLKINGVGKLRQEEYLHRLRFQLLWKTGIHIWLLWDKRKAGSMRDFLTVRGLLNGQGLHRACCSGKRTGRQNCPDALCPAGWELFRNFRHSIPLAGYTAPKPSTMICSLLLLHLPAGWHWLTNQLPLPWH